MSDQASANKTASLQDPESLLLRIRAAELRAARETAAVHKFSADAGDSAAQQPIWGVALSGGGIRSASVGLGLIQHLARSSGFGRAPKLSTSAPEQPADPVAEQAATAAKDESLLDDFDYLSSASGGGYTSSLLQALLLRNGPTTVQRALSAAGNDAHVLPWLRQHSSFLNPSKGAVSGDTLGLIGRVVGPVAVVLSLFLAMGVALCVGLVLLLDTYRYWVTHTSELFWEKTIGTAAILVLIGTSAIWPAVGPLRNLPQQSRSAVNLMLLSIGCLGLSLVALDAEGLKQLDGWVQLIGISVFCGLLATLRKATAWQRCKRAVIATVATLIGLLCFLQLAQGMHGFLDQRQELLMILFAPAVMALLIYFAGVVYQSLAGDLVSNQVREFWARQPAKLIVMVGIAIPLLVIAVFATPYLLQQANSVNAAIDEAGGIAWIAATAWALYKGQALVPETGTSAPTVPISLQILVPLVALGILGSVGWISAQSLLHFGSVNCDPSACFGSWALTLEFWDKWLAVTVPSGWVVLLVLIVASLVLLFRLDPNVISHSAFYADRLSRAFLAPSRILAGTQRDPDPVVGFDSKDDLGLSTLLERPALRFAQLLRPYPLICAAVNVSGRDQLDWQDRKAASFILAPIWSGYLPADRVDPDSSDSRHMLAGDPAPVASAPFDPERLSTQLKLGQAMAISGAAANPLMGSGSKPLLRVLMTLFNVRLGWWVPNRAARKTEKSGRAKLPGLHLLREMLGMADLDHRFLHLSDGGHFENLGIYELVRRRCRFIIVCDAGADPDYLFDDLGRAVRLCRVDLGAEISIDVSGIKPNEDGLAERACAVGTIRYGDGTEGTLLLLKPAITGQEAADVRHYAAVNPAFPQQTTADQFFDEAQFESYRQLGLHIAEEALRPMEGADQIGSVSDQEEALNRLCRAWTPPAPFNDTAFSSHADTIARVFRDLSDESELNFLIEEFYPEWVPVAMQGKNRPFDELPSNLQLQQGFGFCQSLIQLMEQVYLDLRLDRFHDHPDNQGWMNVFHHWSWSPTFRLTWALTQSIFGARFVDFCQRHLELWRVLSLAEQTSDAIASEPWSDLDSELQSPEQERADLLINGLEATLITQQREELRALSARTDVASGVTRQSKTVPLQYQIAVRREGSPVQVCVGYALLQRCQGGTPTLFALRIRDHLRNLGHSRRFQSLLAKHGVSAVPALMASNYGDEPVVTAERKRTLASQFNRLGATVSPD